MINKHTDSWDVLLDVSPGQEIGAPAVQRGLMRRDEIIQAVNAVMRGICCPVLTAEEVYGRGFTVKDPLTQVKIWKQYYPDLDGSCVEEIIKWIDLPCESDGFAVIPIRQSNDRDVTVASI